MNLSALCRVTDEQLRLGVEVVGHNIEVAIVVEIEDGRRPTRSWCHHNRSSALPNAPFASQFFLRLPFLRVRATDLKPGRVEILAWLDTKHKFRIQEFFPVIIQQQGIVRFPPRMVTRFTANSLPALTASDWSPKRDYTF